MFFQGLCPDKNQQQKKEHRNNKRQKLETSKDRTQKQQKTEHRNIKRQKLETEEGDVHERKYKTGHTKSLEGRPK